MLQVFKKNENSKMNESGSVSEIIIPKNIWEVVDTTILRYGLLSMEAQLAIRLGPFKENVICPEHLVTLTNNLDLARLFFSAMFVHPDITDEMGRTPMMMAAQLGNVDMVKLLASYQASVNLVDAEGKGLLFYCLSSKKAKEQLVEMALEMGADVNNVSSKGKSVFLYACEQADKCENICLQLLEKGADPHFVDQVTGNTSLILAAKADSVTLVRELLQRGVNPNAVNKAHQHIAHIAAFKGSMEVLCMLSAYSADFTMTSNLGETPLHVAAAEGHAECCRFLLQRGCPLTRDRRDLNPIQVTIINKQKAALKELKMAAQRVKPEEPSLFHEVRLHDWSLEHKVELMDAFQIAMGLDSTEGLLSVDMFMSVLKKHDAPVDNNILEIVTNKLTGSRDHIVIKEFFLGSKFLPETHVMSSYKTWKDRM